jgi:hypothetical protein
MTHRKQTVSLHRTQRHKHSARGRPHIDSTSFGSITVDHTRPRHYIVIDPDGHLKRRTGMEDARGQWDVARAITPAG